MNRNMLVSKILNQLYSVQFTTDCRTFNRNCIVPMSYGIDSLKSYTEKATGIDRDAVRVITREQVIVFYDFIDQRLLIDNGFIDTYWIDVAIYLIEILDENTISYSLVVAGIESEEVIKAIFQNCYQDAEINIIDYENGWLKRAEKSRLL